MVETRVAVPRRDQQHVLLDLKCPDLVLVHAVASGAGLHCSPSGDSLRSTKTHAAPRRQSAWFPSPRPPPSAERKEGGPGLRPINVAFPTSQQLALKRKKNNQHPMVNCRATLPPPGGIYPGLPPREIVTGLLPGRDPREGPLAVPTGACRAAFGREQDDSGEPDQTGVGRGSRPGAHCAPGAAHAGAESTTRTTDDGEGGSQSRREGQRGSRGVVPWTQPCTLGHCLVGLPARGLAGRVLTLLVAACGGGYHRRAVPGPPVRGAPQAGCSGASRAVEHSA